MTRRRESGLDMSTGRFSVFPSQCKSTGIAGSGATRTRVASAGPESAPDTQKPKRARTSKPKVKTGCVECKKRRIKCDETRPCCTNCLRSKRLCPGYPAPNRSSRPHEQIRIAPKPVDATSPTPSVQEVVQLVPRRSTYPSHSMRPTSPIADFFWHPSAAAANWVTPTLLMPSADLPFEDQEGRYFQLFRERTASELSGYFDSIFWSQMVLQECHSQSVIRHAVVALGALYKTLEKSSESPPASPVDNPTDDKQAHWEVAVRQYSTALRSIGAVGSFDKLPHRTRLMSHVLLACFDSFVGDHQQAITQIKSGMKLLNKLRQAPQGPFFPQQEPVGEELVQMFVRLAIQAKSYDMAFHFPQPFVVDLNETPEPNSPASEPPCSPMSVYSNLPLLPEQFSTLLEARRSWDALVERIFRFTEAMFDMTKSRGTMILPESWQHTGASFENQIRTWTHAFSSILASRAAPGRSSQEKAGIAVLKMMQTTAQILFAMTFHGSEMHFDNFNPQFRLVVDLAQEVVGDEERRAMARRCPDPRVCPHNANTNDFDDVFGGARGPFIARHIKPSFSADQGIVPSLFVVATKCRDPGIRRQAIHLLRSSARREGMWDSELTARIGMWISQVEEDDGYDNVVSPSTSGDNLVMEMEAPDISFDATRSLSLSSGTASPMLLSRNTSVDFGDEARSSMRRSVTRVVPEEKRVMVRSVEFDLRKHFAVVQLGTRGVGVGTPDLRTRKTKITW